MNDGEYAIKKNPDITYISKAIGKEENIRYISKVFYLDEFKDFYYDNKTKEVFEVIRENSIQEITAMYNQENGNLSVRLQRFTKKTGAPQNQSFNFHGGALKKFLNFIESIKHLDLSNKTSQKIPDKNIEELINKNNQISEFINNSKILTSEQINIFFENLDREKKLKLVNKFIDNIESYEAENLDAAIKQREHKKSIAALQKLIDYHQNENFIDCVRNDNEIKIFSANQPEKIFQNWIEKNLWVFGTDFHKKHNFRLIGEDNSQADIVFETPDGYISLIEIKRPMSKSEILRLDKSHRSYFPTSKLSEAIGQCLVYLQRIEDFKKNIEDKNSVRVLRPRVLLIIGRSNDFNKEENEALHLLNSNLHDIEIITYDQMLENGRRIISYYEA